MQYLLVMTRFKKHLCAAALVAGLFAASPGLSCAFHTYIPEETVVDRMLGSDHIVLARANPDDPFRFEPVVSIRGPMDADLPFLVDTVTRRKLAANPEDTVLFARDGAYGPWRRLAYLDTDYRALIDTVATRLDDWELGGDEERFQTFARVQNHENRALRRLALRELDRVPYGILSRLDMTLDAEALMAGIQNPKETEFLPIRILLLGLSGAPQAEDFLRDRFARAIEGPGVPTIGAYATALMELEGGEAVAEFGDLAASPSTNPDTREFLVDAMALQAQAEAPFADEIRAALRTALAADPAMAAPVARQFGIRSDWSFRDSLADLLAERRVRVPTELIVVSQYVAIADEFAASVTTASE